MTDYKQPPPGTPDPNRTPGEEERDNDALRPNDPKERQDDPGFDPESPDVADPQVDPVGAAIAPLDRKPQSENEKKPPYDPLGDLKQ